MQAIGCHHAPSRGERKDKSSRESGYLYLKKTRRDPGDEAAALGQPRPDTPLDYSTSLNRGKVHLSPRCRKRLLDRNLYRRFRPIHDLLSAHPLRRTRPAFLSPGPPFTRRRRTRAVEHLTRAKSLNSGGRPLCPAVDLSGGAGPMAQLYCRAATDG